MIQISCCWSYLVGADNKNPDLSPWLAAFTRTDSGDHVEIAYSQKYINTLETKVVESILSPKQIWAIAKRNSKIESDNRYLYLFHQWYLTNLPIIILYHKLKKEGKEGASDIVKVIENPVGAEFLFDHKGSFTSEQMLALASRYNYDYFEKLNLFLFALHRNIPEGDLLKLFKAWGIHNNIAVYIKNYIIYIDHFFETLSLTQESEKTYIRRLFRKSNQPVTSVLHESVYSQRRILFQVVIEDDKIDANIQDYLLQTVLHKVAQLESSNARFFLYTLLSRPHIYVNIRDFQNRTAIFYAVAHSSDEHFPVVERFLRHDGVVLDVVDSHRKTLTLLAAERGMPRLAQILHKRGAPLPTSVSVDNSFLLPGYQAVWFKYKRSLSVENLAHIFNADTEAVSFTKFQADIVKRRTVDVEMWYPLRYYFLLQFLQNFLHREEKELAYYITSLLFDNRISPKTHSASRAIKAIYEGDTAAFRKEFSEQKNEMEWLGAPFFNIRYSVNQNSFPAKIISDFNIVERLKLRRFEHVDKGLWAFYMGSGSFLSEAVRSVQRESVLFLLEQGVDPTVDRPGFILKDNIMLVILMHRLVYQHKSVNENYLRIVDLLMSHPHVTKDFLEREVIPGINYVDLAVIEGNLPMVKQMYKKGARNSNFGLWNTNVSPEISSLSSYFFKTSEFVLKEKIKDEPNSEFLQEQLRLCRRAFH
ncbi:MAG: hypothetical protein OXM55_03360 [Bdellovibrionales bacterium]|nr:hypothetical protein [Bdellovibrionales bacterium]